MANRIKVFMILYKLSSNVRLGKLTEACEQWQINLSLVIQIYQKILKNKRVKGVILFKFKLVSAVYSAFEHERIFHIFVNITDCQCTDLMNR